MKDSNSVMNFLDRRLRNLLLFQILSPRLLGQDLCTALYPDAKRLGALDSTVLILAVIDGGEIPYTIWKAYKRVDRRWPKYRLVSRVEKLVKRTREKLIEESKLDYEIDDAQYYRRESFLEWIAYLGNPSFLDVITIAVNQGWVPDYFAFMEEGERELARRRQDAARAKRCRSNRKRSKR